jgi:hypothetical protein
MHRSQGRTDAKRSAQEADSTRDAAGLPRNSELAVLLRDYGAEAARIVAQVQAAAPHYRPVIGVNGATSEHDGRQAFVQAFGLASRDTAELRAKVVSLPISDFGDRPDLRETLLMSLEYGVQGFAELAFASHAVGTAAGSQQASAAVSHLRLAEQLAAKVYRGLKLS